MISFRALVRRHCRIYYMDKATVIASLLMPIILIFLYLTILRNVYLTSFTKLLPTEEMLSTSMTNAFVYGWLFAGLLATSGVTVSFCSNIVMSQDRFTGLVRDLAVAPVSRVKLGLSYYFANLFTTLFICLCELVFALILLAFLGWYLTVLDILWIVLFVFLNANFGTALSSTVFLFTTTNGQLAAINTIVSAGYGFFCGAFMPLAGFGEGIQRAVAFFPGSYLTYSLRDRFLNGVMKEMAEILPKESMIQIREGFDLKLSVFRMEVTPLISFSAALSCVVAMILVYILCMRLSKRIGR